MDRSNKRLYTMKIYSLIVVFDDVYFNTFLRTWMHETKLLTICFYCCKFVRLKDENRLMSDEIADKMRLIEKEKSELFTMRLQKPSEMEEAQRLEIERLKDSHRSEVFALYFTCAWVISDVFPT